MTTVESEAGLDPGQLAASTSLVGLFKVNRAGELTGWNAAAERISGYPAQELMHQPLQIIRGRLAGDASSVTEALELWSSAAAPVAGSAKLVDPDIIARDGHEIHAWGGVWPLWDEQQELQGAVGVFSDTQSIRDLLQFVAQANIPRASFPSAGSRAAVATEEPAEAWSEIHFLGNSEVIQDLKRRLDMAASCDVPIILVGADGTGKSLAARYIQGHSARSAQPVRIVNCSALPEWLLESELFGHVAGALPGTTQDKAGAFEFSHQGTLIIESVDAMSAELQQKLARTIQHHELWQVGGKEAVPVHVRVIMTTSGDITLPAGLHAPTTGPLDQIGAFTIRLPTLQECRQDIPLLAEAFLQRFQTRWATRPATLAWETIACLLGHDWPGNMRQLREAIELAATQVHGERLLVTDLPPNLRQARLTGPLPLDTSGKLDAKLAEKREALVGALERAHGNRTIAAKLLGVSRVTLWKRMRQLQVD